MAREERAKSVMAWIALPAAIMLHSITAWIFGLQISRGFWYSSIMAPMFIASALVSGMGLVILLALLLRRLGPAALRGRASSRCWAACSGVFIAVEAFLLLAEYLTALYPGAPEGGPAARMLSGPYLPLFLFEVVVGLVVPFLILAIRPLRQRPGVGGGRVRHRHRGHLRPPAQPGAQRALVRRTSTCPRACPSGCRRTARRSPRATGTCRRSSNGWW